jgi:putative flippase GtrA
VIHSEKLRYLLVGGWNTVFGYLTGVTFFLMLSQHLNIILIAIISNIIAITMSFITYKILVFKTSGRWFTEYLKCYLVYGINALIGVFFLWLFVDRYSINIWLAQGAIIVLTVMFSYLLHKRFTFRRGALPVNESLE